MVGSDSVGGLRNYVSTIRAYDKLFAAIESEEVVENLASKNLVRIMPAKGVTLPPDYQYSEDKHVPRANHK